MLTGGAFLTEVQRTFALAMSHARKKKEEEKSDGSRMADEWGLADSQKNGSKSVCCSGHLLP